MTAISKSIVVGKTYKYDVESIPDVTTDNWYIKSVSSTNTNFSFTIGEDKKSFSYTCSNVEDGTVLTGVEFDLIIGFDNKIGPTRADKTVKTYWDFTVTKQKIPLIIKNLSDKTTLQVRLTFNANFDYYTYIGDIDEDNLPDETLYQRNTSSTYFIVNPNKALYIYSNTITGLMDSNYNQAIYFTTAFGTEYSKGFVEISGSILGLIKNGKLDKNNYKYNGIGAIFKNCSFIKSISNTLLKDVYFENIYRCFCQMFYGCNNLTDVPKDLLPRTKLYGYDYYQMFYNCTSLTTAPELPATTLASYCYGGMFYGCTGLTSIPEGLLPATTLAYDCYTSMFNGCTGLTSIPEGLLPATTLATDCYEYMFYGCTGLTSIPEGLLPATTLESYCYQNMFNGCTGLTSIPEGLLPATELKKSCYKGMYTNCKSISNICDLKNVTILADNCCEEMYKGCTNLYNITFYMNAPILANNCYTSMFRDCTNLKSVNNTTNTYSSFNECGNQSCLKMFSGCTSLTNVNSKLLPATKLATECYSMMFMNCSKLSKAPELPATDLFNYCYNSMFQGCTNLNYIKAMFTTYNAIATNKWVDGVASSGTFVKNASAQWDVTGTSGVPSGWTVVTATD